MHVVFHPGHETHTPKAFLYRGVMQASPERPERAEQFLAAVDRRGDEVVNPDDFGLGPIAAVHSPDYLDFLRSAWHEWQAIGGGAEVIPNVHPGRPASGYPDSIVGRAGFHQADTACPIGEHTWSAAVYAAHSALHAAGLVRDGARSAYALCRPPGHHAFGDMAGGFCFLNNVAVAAHWLTTHGMRAAILDIDVHHGNGTQAIFYARADVLHVSVHTSPDFIYPFFWGFAAERGAGAGAGYNLNLPLPVTTDDDDYLVALETAKSRVRQFSPDVLLIALGLDGFAGDPLRCMQLTTFGFERIGAAIAGLDLPTVIVQEGGYPCPELSTNLGAFLDGFEAAHGVG
ncbi:MAG: histone deacetylase family protein [Pseudomonadota bacterium]